MLTQGATASEVAATSRPMGEHRCRRETMIRQLPTLLFTKNMVMVRRRSSRLPGVRHPRLESQRMTPSLQAPEQDLKGGSDSARVSADPVHRGNQRLQTLEKH
jgi:hypothetical protein